MTDFFTATWLLVTVSAILSAVAAWGATRYAAHRSAAQPVDVDVDAEEQLLDLLDRDPAQWLRVQNVITSEMFTSNERSDRYAHIDAHLRRVAGDLTDGLDARKVPSEVIDTRVMTLRDQFGVGAKVDTKALLAAGRSVAGQAAGRALSTDHSPLIDTGSPTTPLRRIYRPASLAREIVVSVAAGIFGAFAGYGAVLATDTHTAEWLSVAAIVVYIAGGVLLSLVDYDTFYLDTKPFAGWAAVIWVLAAIAGAANHRLDGVLIGFAVGAGAAISFEVVARIMAYTTGRTQGMGDTFTVIVTAGIPAAITSLYHAALWSVLISSLLVLVGWWFTTRNRKSRRDVPVPFVPYLVVGGLVAIGLYGLIV